MKFSRGRTSVRDEGENRGVGGLGHRWFVGLTGKL